MKKSGIRLAVSCLMVASLVLASCGSAVVQDEEVVVEEEEVVTEEREEEAPPPEEDVITDVVTEEGEEVVTEEEEAELLVSGAQVAFEFSEVVVPSSADPRELAVAFHSVSYLDADANTIGELLFGTPEANALQEEGWFGNEEWPDVGPFQWAGGSARKATMRLAIPEGTEGILLYIKPIVDELWMDAIIEGEPATTLRVVNRWHSGYVPIGEGTPEPVRDAGPEWTDGRYFPVFPSTDRVYVFRMHTILESRKLAWTHSFRISRFRETMMALTLVGMQGTINRSRPTIYLDWNEIETEGASGFWVPLIQEHAEVIEFDMDGLSAFNYLLRHYASHFRGAVIYDPEVPDTINLATMLAGLEDRIILAPEQLELPGIPDFDSVTDLRELVREQGWDTSEESKCRLYQWVYDNLWPRLEHRIIGAISPGPPTSQRLPGSSGQFYPLGMAARDYIVALRLAALWLDVRLEPQAQLLDKFLKDESPVPYFGNSPDEVSTVGFVSRHGDWLANITNAGPTLSVGNLTLLSAVRPPLVEYQPEIDPERILATLGDSPVATIFSSDGDAYQFIMDRGFHGPINYVWEKVQGYRYAWEINPTLTEVSPLVWNYYVESRNKVALICGLSGAGYMNPQLMNDTQLKTYLDYSVRYLNDAGLRVLHVDSRFGPWSQVAAQYYHNLRDIGFLGAFVGLAGWPWGLGFEYAGVPVPAVYPSFVLDSRNHAGIIENLLARNSGQVFVHLAGSWPWYWWHEETEYYSWQRGQRVQDNDAFEGQALLLSREDLEGGLVAWGPFATLAPGNYDVAFHLKVPENVDTRPVGSLCVGVQEEDWRQLAWRSISPSDFQQAGQYQDLTLSFTLDDFTQGIQFRIDYFGGEGADNPNWAYTDVYADTITATREGGLDLPVFACVYLSLMTTQRLTEAPQFAEEFERAGGVVLTPDEFMAALNPEYMIEFATPRLGADYPALVQARNQLRDKDFFASLLTVREALRNHLEGP